MRIGIDTHFITSAQSAGGRTYTVELVNALLSLDNQNEYVLYGVGDHPFYHQFTNNQRVTISRVWSPNGLVRNAISLRRAILRDRLDVVHFQFFLPPLLQTASILTIHDLYYIHSSCLSLSERLLGQITLWSAPRAGHVITGSEYSRQDILKHCSVSESRITVIPDAVHPRFHPITDWISVGTIRQRFDIKGDYILFVGRTDDPRKNLVSLIDAYAMLRVPRKINEQLVIVGRHGAGTAAIRKRIHQSGLDTEILLPGVVADDDLPLLMSNAKVFVYVSSFEGFGLPVLEAMACGTPVITANTTSLPEVAGDAALLVAPGKVAELSQTMLMLLENTDLQQELRQRGLERAKLFSWEKTARKTLEVYETFQEDRKNCSWERNHTS